MKSRMGGSTPQAWLAGLGLSPAKVNEVMNSFSPGSSPSLYLYGAGEVFVRFHGAKAASPIFLPNYWVDGSALGQAHGRASQFEGFLSDAEIARVAKTYYRDITAICHNWNDLKDTNLWKITLQGGETIEGLEGPIAAQPAFYPTATQPASASMLSGGALQVFLNPRTPLVCTPVDWS